MGIKTLVLSEREVEVVERALLEFAEAVDRAPTYIRWCERSEVTDLVRKHLWQELPKPAWAGS